MIRIISFGHKYGQAPEAVASFDVRDLWNPFKDENLRPMNGTDKKVQDALFDQETARKKAHDIAEFARVLNDIGGFPDYTITIGCTGGQHRSVAVAERVAQVLATTGCKSIVYHREQESWHGC